MLEESIAVARQLVVAVHIQTGSGSDNPQADTTKAEEDVPVKEIDMRL